MPIWQFDKLYSMFTKVNIPFVCVANSPLLTDRKARGDPETSSGWQEPHGFEISTRFLWSEKMRKNWISQSLPRNGVVIGGENLRPAKSRCSPPKTPLFLEQEKRFRAGLPAKKTLNPSGLKKFWTQNDFQMPALPAKGTLNPRRFEIKESTFPYGK